MMLACKEEGAERVELRTDKAPGMTAGNLVHNEPTDVANSSKNSSTVSVKARN
jgi:hypothetical protein